MVKVSSVKTLLQARETVTNHSKQQLQIIMSKKDCRTISKDLLKEVIATISVTLTLMLNS